MYSKEGEDAILNWVRTLTSGDEPSIMDLGDLANGKIMAQILNRLEAFSDKGFIKKNLRYNLRLISSCFEVLKD